MVSLEDVKEALGVTGNYQDATINHYYDEVVAFLMTSGIPFEDLTVGLVARGVSDLWNYGGAEGTLSEYFYQRAAQLGINNKTMTANDYLLPNADIVQY